MERITARVDVNLDAVPGSFHTPESAISGIQAILSQRIPHYDPFVSDQFTGAHLRKVVAHGVEDFESQDFVAVLDYLAQEVEWIFGGDDAPHVTEAKNHLSEALALLTPDA